MSKVVAGNVRYRAKAKITSTADMRRIAARRPWGRERTGSFKTRIVRSGHSASWGHRRDRPEADIAPGSSRIARSRKCALRAYQIVGSELKPVT